MCKTTGMSRLEWRDAGITTQTHMPCQPSGPSWYVRAASLPLGQQNLLGMQSLQPEDCACNQRSECRGLPCHAPGSFIACGDMSRCHLGQQLGPKVSVALNALPEGLDRRIRVCSFLQPFLWCDAGSLLQAGQQCASLRYGEAADAMQASSAQVCRALCECCSGLTPAHLQLC